MRRKFFIFFICLLSTLGYNICHGNDGIKGKEFNYNLYKYFYDKAISKGEFETTSEFNKKVDDILGKNHNNILLCIASSPYNFEYNADKEEYNYSTTTSMSIRDIELNNKKIKFFEFKMFDTIADNNENSYSRIYPAKKTTIYYYLAIPTTTLNKKYITEDYLKFSFKCKPELAKTIKEKMELLFDIEPIYFKDNNRVTFTNEWTYYDYNKRELSIFRSLFCKLKNIYVMADDKTISKISVDNKHTNKGKKKR